MRQEGAGAGCRGEQQDGQGRDDKHMEGNVLLPYSVILMDTQDIAVGGWALAMIISKNPGKELI